MVLVIVGHFLDYFGGFVTKMHMSLTLQFDISSTLPIRDFILQVPLKAILYIFVGHGNPPTPRVGIRELDRIGVAEVNSCD